MTQTEAQHLEDLCNSMSDTAHGLYNDLMVLAYQCGGAHKLQLHEREVMYVLDAISGGLEVIAGLVQCLEGEMLKARKKREMLENARSMHKHYSSSCAHMLKQGRCDGRQKGR